MARSAMKIPKTIVATISGCRTLVMVRDKAGNCFVRSCDTRLNTGRGWLNCSPKMTQCMVAIFAKYMSRKHE